MKATYIVLFATSFATVRSSYNTGAAAFPTICLRRRYDLERYVRATPALMAESA